MQQWYLTSQPSTFQLLTTVLRMLHRKVTTHINNISLVQIITDPQLSQMSTFISDNCRQVEKLSMSLQSWFREQLYTQNVDMFAYLDEKLENVVETLSKSRQLVDCGCVSVPHQLRKLIVSLNFFQWTKKLLAHISKQLDRLKHLTQPHPHTHLDPHPDTQSSSHNPMPLPKTRLTTIRSYEKAMQSLIQKLSFLLTFLTQTIDIKKLTTSTQSSPIYNEQYQSTLHYMYVVICLLGQQLAQIDDMRWILVRIIQQSKQCYNINILRYFSFSMWRRLILCRQSVRKVFVMAQHLGQYDIVQLAMNVNKVLIGQLVLSSKKIDSSNNSNKQTVDKSSGHNYNNNNPIIGNNNHNNNINSNKQSISIIILNLIYYHGQQSQHHHHHYKANSNNNNYNNTTKASQQQKQQNNININNSFLYFMYRLVMLSRKHNNNINSVFNTVPLFKLFYQIFLSIVLQQQMRLTLTKSSSYSYGYYNSGQGYSKKAQQHYNSHGVIQKTSGQSVMIVKQHHVKYIANVIQRKRYLVFIIGMWCWQEESEKRGNFINNNNYINIKQFIITQLTLTPIFQQLQKTLQSFHQTNKINTKLFYQITSLLLEYVEYYCYDLLSLAYLLQPCEQFERMFNNLTKINDRLRTFLVDKSAGRIETHYTQSMIMKVVKCFQQRKAVPKMKPPRTVFQPSYKKLQQLSQFIANNKHIKFMTTKQIKKLQSTAIRKWHKAISSLETNSLISQTQFLYEIDHFSQIYTIKNKEQLSSVINNQDLLKKLVSTVCNMDRVIKQMENKIFLLIQTNKLVQSKYFSHLINLQQTRSYLSQMILQQLNQSQVYSYDNVNTFINHNYYQQQQQQKWSQSTFVIILKLQLLKNLQYFANQYTLASLQTLITLFSKAQRLYFSDFLKLKITQNQFKQTQYVSLEPYYILFGVIVEQVAFESLGDRELELVLECVYQGVVKRCWEEGKLWEDGQDKKSYNSNSKNGSINRQHLHKRLHQKLLQKLSKQPRTQMTLNTISKQFMTKSNNINRLNPFQQQQQSHQNQNINSLTFTQQQIQIQQSYYYLLQRIQRSQTSGDHNNQQINFNNSSERNRFATILALF